MAKTLKKLPPTPVTTETEGAGTAPARAAKTPPLLGPIRLIHLDLLEVSEHNVRKTGKDDNLAELEASVRDRNFFGAIIVVKEGDKYGVVAGGRRLRVLKNIAAAGDHPVITKDFEVPCQELPPGVDAADISLAENVVRERMHPLDESEAFRFQAEKQNKTLEEIGAAFGCTTAVVKKRLALSDAADVVKEAFRKGRINLAQAQAFSVTTDKKWQEKLLKEAERTGRTRSDGTLDLDEGDLRETLTEDKISSADARVLFVGLEAYTAAGGVSTPDFFEGGAFIENPKLLDTLVREKLEQVTAGEKSEGWSFVKSSAKELGWSETSQYEQAPHKAVKLEKDEEAALKAYKKELQSLPGQWDRSEAEKRRFKELHALIAPLEAKGKSWSPNIKAESGVLIGLNDDGTLDIRRGMMTKKAAEDKRREKEKAVKQAAKKSEKPEKPADPAKEIKKAQKPDGTDENLATKLMEELTTHRSFAIAAVLAKNPKVALAAHIAALAASSAGDGMDCVHVSFDEQSPPLHMSKRGTVKGYDVLEDLREKLEARLPKKGSVFAWALTQKTETLLELQALYTALSFEDVNMTGRRDEEAEAIWRTLGVDMAAWFTATADNLFTRVPSHLLRETVKECRKLSGAGVPDTLTPAELKLKKDGLAQLTEREAAAAAKAGKPWLPHPLRLPGAKTPEAAKPAARAKATPAKKGTKKK